MNKPKIAVDIDLCITNDLGQRWWDFLTYHWKDYQSLEQYNQFVEDYENRKCSYNLTEYFNLPKYVSKMGFWGQYDLYANEVLQEGCYEVIKNLWQAGFDVYFVSVCQPEHIQSKINFLERSFDFMEEIKFVNTVYKGCMDGSAKIVIDDRMENLNQFKSEDTLKILFDTPYKQEVESEQEYVVAKDWESVESFICEFIEEKL
jgi:5'(3')-deoxyribonucleotidase